MKRIDSRSRAESRARAYRLLAGIFRRGPVGELRKAVAAVPDLGEHLSTDADADAACHHALFGLDVFPYASHFLDPDGQLGGVVAEATARLYASSGVKVPPGEEPDHLATVLDALSALASSHDQAPARVILDQHLLWWLPPFTIAIRRAATDRPEHALYRTAAEVVMELVLDHRADLGAGAAGVSGWPPAAEGPPGEGGGGLAAMARFFTTPARAGVHLGRSELGRMARALDLPMGFGGRALLFENLLGAAVRFDREEGVVQRLREVLDAWRKELKSMEELPGPPVLGAALGHWQERIHVSRTALEGC